MVTRLTDPDLQALDDIWPIGRQLVIPDGGTVVIAGAYKGRYMHYIAEAYPKTKLILGFEPQPAAAKEASKRIKRYPNCRLDWRALGIENRDEIPMGNWGSDGCSIVNLVKPIGLASGGCSIVNLVKPIGLASMVEFREAMDEDSVTDIDCFICNMEGYEYKLIPHIFKNRLDSHIKSMAIQFHPSGLPREEFVHNMVDQHYAKKIDSPGWEYWFNA